jgi:hypothetical protein
MFAQRLANRPIIVAPDSGFRLALGNDLALDSYFPERLNHRLSNQQLRYLKRCIRQCALLGQRKQLPMPRSLFGHPFQKMPSPLDRETHSSLMVAFLNIISKDLMVAFVQSTPSAARTGPNELCCHPSRVGASCA